MRARVQPGEHRLRLRVHYDGGGFAGWQVQPGARTVQGEIEAALARLTAAPRRVIGAGRTDAGVHATGQVLGVDVPVRWTPAELTRALNAVLPHDVWVAGADAVPADFHARYDAVARRYVYRLGTTAVSRSPFLRRWCWPLAEPLPLDVLNDAAQPFVGQHSFRAFAKTGQPERGERCTVRSATWTEWSGVGVSFQILADRYLHHMVRYMVGTLVDVARGRRPAADIQHLLGGAPGLETSPPAPATGLYLTKVYYPDDDSSGEDASNEILS